MQVERIHKEPSFSAGHAERLIKSVKKTETTDAVDPELGYPHQRREERRSANNQPDPAVETEAEVVQNSTPPDSNGVERIDVLA